MKTLKELRIKQYFNLWKEETHNKIECPLCITRVPKENCYTTDCGHTFCNDCIGTWKQQCFNKATDATCPICREVFDYRPIVYSTPVPQREEQLIFSEEERNIIENAPNNMESIRQFQPNNMESIRRFQPNN